MVRHVLGARERQAGRNRLRRLHTGNSARIVHAFHAPNAGLRTDVWFEYVASKANIADLPHLGWTSSSSGACRRKNASVSSLQPRIGYSRRRRGLRRGDFARRTRRSTRRGIERQTEGGGVRQRRHGMRKRAVAGVEVDVARLAAPMAAALGMANTAIFTSLYVRDGRQEDYDVYVESNARIALWPP